jgi:hypothetical protein
LIFDLVITGKVAAGKRTARGAEALAVAAPDKLNALTTIAAQMATHPLRRKGLCVVAVREDISIRSSNVSVCEMQHIPG